MSLMYFLWEKANIGPWDQCSNSTQNNSKWAGDSGTKKDPGEKQPSYDCLEHRALPLSWLLLVGNKSAKNLNKEGREIKGLVSGTGWKTRKMKIVLK